MKPFQLVGGTPGEGNRPGVQPRSRRGLTTFKQLIAEVPDSPAGYRLAAATLWIKLLFEQGAVTVDDYLGQARSDARRLPPTPALAAQFDDYLRRGSR